MVKKENHPLGVPMPSQPPAAGFTLFEVLVALFLFSLSCYFSETLLMQVMHRDSESARTLQTLVSPPPGAP